MENGNREFGGISERLRYLESEVEKARLKLHEHANTITGCVNWITVFKEYKIDDRLKSLEGWRQWVLGASAIVGIVFGLIGGWIAKHF